MATLAAFDIARQAQELGIRQEQVACYTFGAPRTGNAAFAEAFNRTVPDTWMIINGQAWCPICQHLPAVPAALACVWDRLGSWAYSICRCSACIYKPAGWGCMQYRGTWAAAGLHELSCVHACSPDVLRMHALGSRTATGSKPRSSHRSCRWPCWLARKIDPPQPPWRSYVFPFQFLS